MQSNIATIVKQLRKKYQITQEELALKSGVGLSFIRSLEQGKQTLRMDKVNLLLEYFNYEVTAQPKQRESQPSETHQNV